MENDLQIVKLSVNDEIRKRMQGFQEKAQKLKIEAKKQKRINEIAEREKEDFDKLKEFVRNKYDVCFEDQGKLEQKALLAITKKEITKKIFTIAVPMTSLLGTGLFCGYQFALNGLSDGPLHFIGMILLPTLSWAISYWHFDKLQIMRAIKRQE